MKFKPLLNAKTLWTCIGESTFSYKVIKKIIWHCFGKQLQLLYQASFGKEICLALSCTWCCCRSFYEISWRDKNNARNMAPVASCLCAKVSGFPLFLFLPPVSSYKCWIFSHGCMCACWHVHGTFVVNDW